MLKNLMTGAAAVALSVTAMSGAANALLIDDFSKAAQKIVIGVGDPNPQALLDNAGGLAVTDPGPHDTIIGGYRDVKTTFIDDSGDGGVTEARVTAVGAGRFIHDQGSGVSSNTYITWGGTGDQLDGVGLGGKDLTDMGSSDKFHLQVINADATVVWTLYLEDADGDVAFFSFANLADINPPGTDLYLPFTYWTSNAGESNPVWHSAGGSGFNAALNFNKIEFIQFGANITNFEDFDTTVDIIETVGVPEPASLTLLGAGIMGLGYFGKRRKA